MFNDGNPCNFSRSTKFFFHISKNWINKIDKSRRESADGNSKKIKVGRKEAAMDYAGSDWITTEQVPLFSEGNHLFD